MSIRPSAKTSFNLEKNQMYDNFFSPGGAFYNLPPSEHFNETEKKSRMWKGHNAHDMRNRIRPLFETYFPYLNPSDLHVHLQPEAIMNWYYPTTLMRSFESAIRNLMLAMDRSQAINVVVDNSCDCDTIMVTVRTDDGRILYVDLNKTFYVHVKNQTLPHAHSI
jgi:hypothetical protein